MKKSRLIVLLSLVLCVATFFAACGNRGPKLKDFYNMDEYAYENENIVPTKGELLSDYVGATASVVGGKVVKFVEGDTTALYDMVANKKIWSFTKTDKTSLDSIDPIQVDEDLALYVIVVKTVGEEEDTYKTTIINQNGAEIASADDKETATLKLDLIFFNDIVYRIDAEGKIAKAFDYNFTAGIPSISEYNESYYFAVDSKGIAVYDLDLKLVAAHKYPSYASGVKSLVTNDGNVLFQYSLELPEDATDYTYLNGTKKMQLISGLYNVKKNTVEDLDLDYVIADGYSRSVKDSYAADDLLDYNEKFEQIVLAYDIVDERIDKSDAAVKLYAINGEGKVKATINELIMAQGYNEPVAVAPNRYVVENYLGQALLLDEDGAVIGDVSEVDTPEHDNFKAAYMVVDGKLFNYDLKMIYDYEEAELTVAKLYDNCALFVNEDGEYFLFKNGAATKIIEKPAEGATTVKSLTYKDNYFVITTVNAADNKTTYEYYNVDGAKINVESKNFTIVATYDGYMLAKTTDTEGKAVYYRFS